MASWILRLSVNVVRAATLGLFLLGGTALLVWDSVEAPKAYFESRGSARDVAGIPAGSGVTPDQQTIALLRGELESQSKELDIQEKRVDALRARAADIQALLTILLGLGTIYAVAQAIFSHLNVESFTKKAEAEVAGIRSEWEKFLEKSRAEFPRFVGMETIMGSVFSELIGLLRNQKDIAFNAYDQISPASRQRVYFFEKSLAGLEYLQVEESADNLFTIFRGLGLFYSSKYESEHTRAGSGVAFSDDLERGKFYLALALRQKPGDYRIKNDMSRIADVLENDSPRAVTLSMESLEANGEQQRAYYNLGNILHLSGQYRDAIEKFEEGLKREDWEERPVRRNTASLHFNLACSRCMLHASKGAANLPRADEATVLEGLKKAVAADETIASDVAKDPDLKIFRDNPQNARDLDQLLKP